MSRNALAIAMVSSATLLFYGCVNVFDPVDSPTSPDQILSAARAEFDEGHYDKAREYYAKLGNNDSAEAELSFVDMNEAGITMGVLVSAVRISSGETPGAILTNLAEALAKDTVTTPATRRVALARAYARVSGVENQQLRGFVRFLVGLSIAADILGENALALNDGALAKADIVTSPSGCPAPAAPVAPAVVPACAAASGCDENPASNLPTGSVTAGAAEKFISNTDTTVDLNTPSYSLMVNAFLGATAGLDEMAVKTGDAQKLSTQIKEYAAALAVASATGNATATTAAQRCFLSSLINTAGVGR